MNLKTHKNAIYGLPRNTSLKLSSSYIKVSSHKCFLYGLHNLSSIYGLPRNTSLKLSLKNEELHKMKSIPFNKPLNS